jgi:type IV fimbrial biogenesis protein FimT
MVRAQKAFTLIEILVTVAVAGVLLGIAAPAFTTFVLNNRITSQTNDLIAILAVARSESAKRGVRVTVCATTDYSTPSCTGGGASAWKLGYIAFADQNGNGAFDAATDVLLRVGQPLSGGNTLTSSGFSAPAAADKFQYRPSGSTNLPAAGGSFTLCDNRHGLFGRLVSISVTGRAIASVTSC